MFEVAQKSVGMPLLDQSDLLWVELALIAQAESLVLYDAERFSAGLLRVAIDRPRAATIDSASDEVAELGGVTSGD